VKNAFNEHECAKFPTDADGTRTGRFKSVTIGGDVSPVFGRFVSSLDSLRSGSRESFHVDNFAPSIR
jgi:hypothetical protein